MINPDFHLSFEFSAPRALEARQDLARVYEQLCAFEPEFFSVTYGAGGSTRQGTLETVLELNDGPIRVAPHLSFGLDDDHVIVELLETYREAKVDRIVALRGDVPSGAGGRHGLRYASDLVKFIRRLTGDHFHIEVAAYPETHPDSPSVEHDIQFLKIKIDAGADSVLTQYFYNADAFFHYRDQCQRAGIDAPIIPGIMPITNYKNLQQFSDKCGAEIPRWMRRQLESYGDDAESVRAFGEEVVTRLCERLLQGGVPGLHFYTMNRAKASARICRSLGFGRPAD